MDPLHTVKDKEIVIIGLARSGVAVAKLLHQQGAKIIVNDNKKIEDCPEADELLQLGIRVICGGHPEDLIHAGLDFVIKNPGIPYRIAPLQKAMEQNIPIYTEVEIASWFMKAPIIGITGSNGKTTTTSLIGSILDEAGRSPIVAGNIGVALSEVAPKATEDQWVVAELSSFQLAGTHYFHPKIALLLNLFPAHLDFHGTIEDYEESKAKIFANQKQSDYAILNADNEDSLKWLSTIQSEVLLFSRLKRVDYGVYVDQGTVWYNDKCGLTISIMEVKDIKLLGQHNLENVLAAICTAIICEVDMTTIERAVSTFEGVEHRLEYVRTKEGVLYYNDSKATNPVASIVSIESFKQPIIWIAGGLNRGTDFLEMFPTVKDRVKAIVCFGQTKEILYELGIKAGLSKLRQVDNVNEAVEVAQSFAESGDIVLLSPACASWDMYPSFEVRGRMFKESVHNL